MVSHFWQDCWHSSPQADDVSCHVNSPGLSHLFSQLISDREHLYLTHFVYAYYYLLSLSVLCRTHGLSHTLGKLFSKAKLSVDVHHPLADNVSCHVNSPGTPYLFS